MLFALICVTPACGPPECTQVEASYDKKTGRLRRLSYDSNKNGTPDSFAYMDEAKVLRVEIDKDEDGRIDLWEYYDADQRLEKVAVSRLTNGQVDEWAYEGPNGTVAKIEMSTRQDGKVQRTEFYERGALAHAEEDTDGNGTVDKWEAYANGVLASVAFDTEGAGRPTRRLVYQADGKVRVETGAALVQALSKP